MFDGNSVILWVYAWQIQPVSCGFKSAATALAARPKLVSNGTYVVTCFCFCMWTDISLARKDLSQLSWPGLHPHISRQLHCLCVCVCVNQLDVLMPRVDRVGVTNLWGTTRVSSLRHWTGGGDILIWGWQFITGEQDFTVPFLHIWWPYLNWEVTVLYNWSLLFSYVFALRLGVTYNGSTVNLYRALLTSLFLASNYNKSFVAE
jgi:hypothetical protein